jgi:hypothetical protein
VAAAVVVAAVLHLALPAKYQVIPPWVAPTVLLALLAAQRRLHKGVGRAADSTRRMPGVVTGVRDAGIRVMIILGAVAGLVWHDRGLSFRAAVSKAPRAR